MHTRSQAAVKIAGLETRRDLFINDPFAKRVGQNAFQSVPNLQKHFVVLDKNKEYCSIVLVALSHLPGSRHAHCIIFDG
jgi:hypothetical protein